MTLRKIVFSVIFVFSSISFVFSDSGYFIGDGAKGKRILVYTSVIENGGKSDSWIASKVKRDLTNDLVNYSNMDIIDSDEKATVRKLQKDSLSAMYSDDDPIELGKTIQAKSYIRLVTTCKKNFYSLTATLTNIETSRTEGSYTSPFYSESDFVSKVHGEAAISLLDSLGVKLTTAGKRLLQYGSFAQTENESKENLAVYQAELARLEKEQNELKSKRNTNLDAEALNAKIEVQKATLLQQQKNEEERLARLREDTKRKFEEERISKERNAEAQRKILVLSNEIEEKAAKIRKQKTENLSAFQQMDVIEGEKQILASNEKSIQENISSFNEAQNNACEKEIATRKKQKPRMSEINSDGSVNDTGIRNLESDIEAIKLKYDRLKSENEKEIKNKSDKTQKVLREKIMGDIEELERKFYTADSLLNDGVYFRVGDYDGSSNRNGWNYTLVFVFDGQTVYTENGIFPYENITGKSVPSYPASNDSHRDEKIALYNEYQDNVEIYDSFFRLNVPYIQALLTYSISADDSKVSEYAIKVKKVNFKNIKTEKFISSSKVKTKKVSYIFNPKTSVDWTFKNYYVSERNRKIVLSSYGNIRFPLGKYADYMEQETGIGLGAEFVHKQFRKGEKFGSSIHAESLKFNPKSFIYEQGFSIKSFVGIWYSVPIGRTNFSIQPSLEFGIQYLKGETTEFYKELKSYFDIFSQVSLSFRYLNKNNGFGFEVVPLVTCIPYSENPMFAYGARAGILFSF